MPSFTLGRGRTEENKHPSRQVWMWMNLPTRLIPRNGEFLIYSNKCDFATFNNVFLEEADVEMDLLKRRETTIFTFFWGKKGQFVLSLITSPTHSVPEALLLLSQE